MWRPCPTMVTPRGTVYYPTVALRLIPSLTRMPRLSAGKLRKHKKRKRRPSMKNHQKSNTSCSKNNLITTNLIRKIEKSTMYTCWRRTKTSNTNCLTRTATRRLSVRLNRGPSSVERTVEKSKHPNVLFHTRVSWEQWLLTMWSRGSRLNKLKRFCCAWWRRLRGFWIICDL